MYANLIALWSRRVARVRTRVVIVEQNTFSCSYQQLPKWYGFMMLQLMRWSYPNADAIVAVSTGVANDLARVTGINGRRIRVIYNPVITPELRRKALAPPNHPWLKQQSIPVILAVGRLTPQKDYPNLLRAFALLRQKRPVRLLILGEGPERSVLETLAKQLGIESDIHLPGFAENPYPMMAGASVYVLSSRWEGLPTVLIEALYCSTPVVATNCPSGPSEILLGGKYGTLVDVGDSSALAQAIAAVLDSERVSAPRESWLPFDSDTVLRDYSDVMFGE